MTARIATLRELPLTLSAAELTARAAERLARADQALATLRTAATPPTIEGFLAPLDRALVEVRDLSAHGGLVFAVHPEEAVRTAGREAAESAERFFNRFRLEVGIYRTLGTLLETPGLDRSTKFAIEKLRREMRRSGVEKDEAGRRHLLELSDEIDRVSNEYMENIAKGRRSIAVASAAELAGLPADYVSAHAPGADGAIRLTTDYPDFRPVMAYADDPEVRRRLLHEFTNRAYPENDAVLAKLLERRRAFATGLGYADYASFALEDKMIETPEHAHRFLGRVGGLVRSAAERDVATLLARKRRDHPEAARLENWDIGLFADGYYSTRLRQEEYGVDAKRLRAYLPYGRVRDGLFALCHELFGLSFHPGPKEVRWHPSVEVFDVTRGDVPVGRFYLDMVPREGKYNHAACFGVREGLLGGDLPQSALICNFLDPTQAAETARMEYGDVVTFFHEFGHLLHALLSGHVRWLYNSQSLIEWDFVEAPSQLFEEWARDPATLARFARDPDRNEPIPPELLDRLHASESFGRASRWLRQVAFSDISLSMYSGPTVPADVAETFRTAYARHSPLPLGPDDHPEAGFGHLVGYSAFYYTYVWSVVIARDLLTPFRERGSLTDPETSRRYALQILAAGSERPAAELIEAFLGRPFGFDAFEAWVAERPTPAPDRPRGPSGPP